MKKKKKVVKKKMKKRSVRMEDNLASVMVNGRKIVLSDGVFKVDVEQELLDSGRKRVGWTYVTYYPHRRGSQDTDMVRAIAKSLKRIGVGGRIIEMDGTPEGKIIESWYGVARLSEVEQIERARMKAEEIRPDYYWR